LLAIVVSTLLGGCYPVAVSIRLLLVAVAVVVVLAVVFSCCFVVNGLLLI
jgi:hypothetical protein